MFMSITFTTFSLHLLRCKNDTVEFLAFPIRVLNSNYRLRTDRLATVHECDQGTNTMSFTSHYTVSDNKCLSQRQMSRDVKVSRPCWSRDRKLWSRSRTIRSRSHECRSRGLEVIIDYKVSYKVASSAPVERIFSQIEIAIPSHFESSGISGLLCQISGNSGIFLYSINLFQNSIYRFILRRNLLSSLLQQVGSPLT